MLANLLARKVKRERRRVPRTKLLLEMLVDRALEGDWQAMKLVVSMMNVHDTLREPVSFGKKDAVDFDAMAAKFGRGDSDTQASVDTRAAGRGPHAGNDDSYFAELAAQFGNGPMDRTKSNAVDNNRGESREKTIDHDHAAAVVKRADALIEKSQQLQKG
jgi:hypothetical protein